MAENWLGLIFHCDANFLDDPSAAATELRQLDADGWIMLKAADTVGTELAQESDDNRRSMLKDEASNYPEAWGSAAFDESRIDSSLIGSDDEARFDRIFALLFPGADRDSTSRNAGNQRRDAMHVATALRYGAGIFITHDRALLEKAGAVAAQFNDFKIMEPEHALAFARRMKDRSERRKSHPLPPWR